MEAPPSSAVAQTLWQREGKIDQFPPSGTVPKRNLHLCCLFLSLLIYVAVTTLALTGTNAQRCYSFSEVGERELNESTNSTVQEKRNQLCKLVEYYVRYFGPPVLIIASIGYVINCAKCSIRNSFANKVRASDAQEHIRQLVAGQPNLAWRATAYHTEMRTKFVLSFAHTTVMRQKVNMLDRVNTASRVAYFDYTKHGQLDKSKIACSNRWPSDQLDLDLIEKHNILNLTVVKKFAFENNLVERDCERQRTQFFDQLQGLDQHLEIAQVFQIEGKTADTEHLTVCADDCPVYMNTATFWFLSALVLSWPYRIFIEHLTRRVEFHVQKVFGNPKVMARNMNTSAEADTRTSSLCTLELDSFVNQSRLVAPAYTSLLEADRESDDQSA